MSFKKILLINISEGALDPEYWNKLKDLQSKTSRPMKYNKYTVNDLEEKFNNE